MKITTIVGAVVIIGVLFYLGILSPAKFGKVKCRARQHDATSNLEDIRKRIGTNLSKGEAAGSFSDLAWSPKTNDYDYNISIGFNGHFTVEARAENNNGDVWTIDEVGNLNNKVDGCVK